MTDRFRVTMRGHVRSTEGWSVRIGSRSGIEYCDELGHLHVDAERMATPSTEFVVYSSSIPDLAERPRALVVDRLRRVLLSQGATLVEEPGEG